MINDLYKISKISLLKDVLLRKTAKETKKDLFSHLSKKVCWNKGNNFRPIMYCKTQPIEMLQNNLERQLHYRIENEFPETELMVLL